MVNLRKYDLVEIHKKFYNRYQNKLESKCIYNSLVLNYEDKYEHSMGAGSIMNGNGIMLYSMRNKWLQSYYAPITIHEITGGDSMHSNTGITSDIRNLI